MTFGLVVSAHDQNVSFNTSNIRPYTNVTTDPPDSNTTTDFCKIFHNKKTITQEEAESKVGPWF